MSDSMFIGFCIVATAGLVVVAVLGWRYSGIIISVAQTGASNAARERGDLIRLLEHVMEKNGNVDPAAVTKMHAWERNEQAKADASVAAVKLRSERNHQPPPVQKQEPYHSSDTIFSATHE